MKKPVILDCDGVLLNWIDGVRRFHEHLHGVTLDAEGPESYDPMKWLGLSSPEEVKELIIRFNSGEAGFFSDLRPVTGALEAVQTLKDNGHDLCVLTQCSTDPAVTRGRDENLRKVFGGFDNIMYVDLGGSKREYLESLPPSWFIEDNLANAFLGEETGHSSILLEYPYNAGGTSDETFRRAANWSEVVQMVCERVPEPDMMT